MLITARCYLWPMSQGLGFGISVVGTDFVIDPSDINLQSLAVGQIQVSVISYDIIER